MLKAKEDVGFTVRLDELQYKPSKDDYFRTIAPKITKNTWTLENEEAVDSFQFKADVIEQTNEPTLFISNSALRSLRNVQTPIELGLKIDASVSHLPWEELNAQFKVSLDPCASFYDERTGEAYVVEHLTSERGTIDFKFKYSGTSCSEFNFDQLDDSSIMVELFYGEQQKIELLRSGSTQVQRAGNEVTVRRNLLSSMPYNEPFYIVCSAKFQDASKTNEQYLSIIYKLDWQSNIYLDLAPLDIGVPQGRDLLVDASEVEIVNTADKATLQNYLEWVWLCPTSLDCARIDTNNQRLVVENRMLTSLGNMDYMTKYTFVLRVRTRRNVPDEVPFLQRLVNVTWIGPPTNVEIVQPSSLFSISADVVFEVNVEDRGWFDECDIEWAVLGADTETGKVARALNATTDFKNSNDQIKFILSRNTLTAYGQYQVFLRLYAKKFDKPLVFFTSRSFEIVTNPYGGQLRVEKKDSPGAAPAYELSAENWISYSRGADGLGLVLAY